MRLSAFPRFILLAAAGSALLVLVSLMIAAPPSAAKPKKPSTDNGCTTEQVQSPGGSRCVDKSYQDLLDGVAYPHVVMCDETGAYCCQSDGTRFFACKRFSTFRTQGLSPIYHPPGGLKVNPGH